MKVFLPLSIFMLLALSATKCKNTPADGQEFLFQAWTHSHEEDTEEARVYRPASFNFPPSRGRQSFEIKSDGSLIAKGPGADDRPETKKGNWSVNDKTLQLSFADQNVQTFTIVSLAKDKLVLTPQNP